MSNPAWIPPPPWKAERWTKERWGTWDADAIKSADGHIVAMVVRHDPSTADDQLTSIAHLLVAAPAMYEALSALLTGFPSGKIRKMGSDALAKARGESQ